MLADSVHKKGMVHQQVFCVWCGWFVALCLAFLHMFVCARGLNVRIHNNTELNLMKRITREMCLCSYSQHQRTNFLYILKIVCPPELCAQLYTHSLLCVSREFHIELESTNGSGFFTEFLKSLFVLNYALSAENTRHCFFCCSIYFPNVCFVGVTNWILCLTST